MTMFISYLPYLAALVALLGGVLALFDTLRQKAGTSEPRTTPPIQAAYSNWSSLLGIAFAAMGLVSGASHLLQLDASRVFYELLSAYRAIFYPILEWVLAPFQVRVSGWLRDAIIIWVAVGAATSRVFFVEYNLLRSKAHAEGRKLSPWVGLVRPLIAFFAWPIGVFLVFRHPHIVYNERLEGEAGRTEGAEERDQEIAGDLRVVFFLQVASIIAAAVILIALNTAF